MIDGTNKKTQDKKKQKEQKVTKKGTKTKGAIGLVQKKCRKIHEVDTIF